MGWLQKFPFRTTRVPYTDRKPTHSLAPLTPPEFPTEADAVVIGSGPSGLVTAIMLARQGKSVLVLEQHDRVGGGEGISRYCFCWTQGGASVYCCCAGQRTGVLKSSSVVAAV